MELRFESVLVSEIVRKTGLITVDYEKNHIDFDYHVSLQDPLVSKPHFVKQMVTRNSQFPLMFL